MNFLSPQLLIPPRQIKYLGSKLPMTPHLVCQLFQNEKTFDKKFYAFFVINHKEKTIHKSLLSKWVIVGHRSHISLLKVTEKS